MKRTACKGVFIRLFILVAVQSVLSGCHSQSVCDEAEAEKNAAYNNYNNASNRYDDWRAAAAQAGRYDCVYY